MMMVHDDDDADDDWMIVDIDGLMTMDLSFFVIEDNSVFVF